MIETGIIGKMRLGKRVPLVFTIINDECHHRDIFLFKKKMMLNSFAISISFSEIFSLVIVFREPGTPRRRIERWPYLYTNTPFGGKLFELAPVLEKFDCKNIFVRPCAYFGLYTFAALSNCSLNHRRSSRGSRISASFRDCGK